MSAIVAPVSRFLRATDLARTEAFYHDVLGFDVEQSDSGSEALEVRLALRASISISMSTDSRIETSHSLVPPSSFSRPTTSIDSMREFGPAAVRPAYWSTSTGSRCASSRLATQTATRSGSVSRSPNLTGRLHRACSRRSCPSSRCRTCAQVWTTIATTLGFSVNYEQPDLAVMDRDDVRLLLVARTERHAGIGSAYVYVHDADALHHELRSRGARLQGDPVSQPWGLREFRVLDVEGNQITFGQPFE